MDARESLPKQVGKPSSTSQECDALRVSKTGYPTSKEIDGNGKGAEGSQRALTRIRGRKEVPSGRTQARLVFRYEKAKAEGKDEAMISRFDHRPMLTAVLALTTTLLVVVVLTLAALLFTAQPPAATSSGQGGAANTGAVVVGTRDNYGDEWNNYGHDWDRPQPAETGNGANPAIERHAAIVAAYKDNK